MCKNVAISAQLVTLAHHEDRGMTSRRELTFKGLDEVLPVVEQLLDGHSLAGQWSLAQIWNHLATTIRLTARPASDPGQGTPEQATLRQGFFAVGVFPLGRPSPPPFVPREGLDQATEVASLVDAIQRFQAATGPFPAHPMLGPLSRDQWVQFHSMHAAHHLGFALPK
jgi:hypothetical protein